MAGATPEEAVDEFVGRIRSTLDCFLSGTAFGSGNAVGPEHSVTLYTVGQTLPNISRLSTHDGEDELLFQFAHLYRVDRLTDVSRQNAFRVSTSFYQYRILDRHERELVVYDWAPAGISPVRTPHMHIPAAGSVILPQRAGSRIGAQKSYLDDLHFPTGATILEQGVPPPYDAVAADLDVSSDRTREAYERLHARHALFLTPGTHSVRMAHPFSGVPTPFRVHANHRAYWANCAWDAFGIPAALHADAHIDAETGDESEPIHLTVTDGRVTGWDGVVHFALPFRRWYDDLIRT